MKKFIFTFIFFCLLFGCKKIQLTSRQEDLKREIWNSENYTLLLVDDGTIYILKHIISDRIQFCAASYPCTSYSFDALDIKVWKTKNIIRPNDPDYSKFAVLYLKQR